jgi:serine/threonine protein kinase/Tol biopolymer transport system component
VQELSPGALLGHYKVIRRLGQGGMGVVWEAVDQKLGRHVAVKVLTEATRDSSAALERFWREARAASALNHPGICTIHELDESAETPFIVMELMEGNSLEKLYRGRAMPYPKLLEMGVQLADALDAAHRKGILHRDIKPANIFITNSGQAKLLDFGLAKLDSAGASADASTAVRPLSDSKSTMGTVAYMSPEQARGEPLDTRSDLFSLGVVLYEMATGRHPFPGATTAVVFNRILNESPVAPISLNPQLPVEFESILNKALEKDRELRCQSAAELRADLKRLQRNSGPVQPLAGIGSSSAHSVSSTSAPQPVVRKSTTLIFAVACLVLAAAGFAAWRFWPRARPFADISVDQVTNVGTIERLALSGDGRFLAEVKNDKGQRTLWVRNTATNTDTQILGAFGNEYVGLTFSPDSNYLYFVRGNSGNGVASSLYVMPVFGGTPRQLIEDIDSTVSFSPDGNRYTYLQWTPERKDQASEVHIANRDGGNNQVIYATKEWIGPPVWSPDGGRIAWIGTTGSAGKHPVQILDLSSKKLTTVPAQAEISFQDGYTNLMWMPDGRRLLAFYLKPRTDHAQIGILTLPSGEFHRVTNDVNAYTQLALSADGHTLATVLTNIDSSIAWYKPEGGVPLSTTPLRITPGQISWASEDRLLFSVPRFAIGWIDRATGDVQSFDVGEIDLGDSISSCPDGHILFTGFPKGAAQPRLFRMDADGGNIFQLTNDGIARFPQCSADSRQALYGAAKDEIFIDSLWAVSLAGGAPRQLLPSEATADYAISQHGRLAGYDVVAATSKVHWKVFDLASGRILSEVVLDSSDIASERGFVHFSPDNRAIVYSVLRSGGRTLLYQPLDGSTPHQLLDTVQEGITDFGWSPSGKQLAVLRLKTSSDVVLIKDQREKGKD